MTWIHTKLLNLKFHRTSFSSKRKTQVHSFEFKSHSKVSLLQETSRFNDTVRWGQEEKGKRKERPTTSVWNGKSQRRSNSNFETTRVNHPSNFHIYDEKYYNNCLFLALVNLSWILKHDFLAWSSSMTVKFTSLLCFIFTWVVWIFVDSWVEDLLLFICNWNKERWKPRGKNVTMKLWRVIEVDVQEHPRPTL